MAAIDVPAGQRSIQAVPAWAPFVGLVPAVVGLYFGNAWLSRVEQDSVSAASLVGASCHTPKPVDQAMTEVTR